MQWTVAIEAGEEVAGRILGEEAVVAAAAAADVTTENSITDAAVLAEEETVPAPQHRAPEIMAAAIRIGDPGGISMYREAHEAVACVRTIAGAGLQPAHPPLIPNLPDLAQGARAMWIVENPIVFTARLDVGRARGKDAGRHPRNQRATAHAGRRALQLVLDAHRLPSGGDTLHPVAGRGIAVAAVLLLPRQSHPAILGLAAAVLLASRADAAAAEVCRQRTVEKVAAVVASAHAHVHVH